MDPQNRFPSLWEKIDELIQSGDIVAFDPATKRRLGISVKSRTRRVGREAASVNLFKKGKRRDDRQKLVDECVYFNCEPWIAIYVEWTDGAELYLTSLENYETKHRGTGTTVDTWRMGKKLRAEYAADSEVMHIEVSFKAHRWW